MTCGLQEDDRGEVVDLEESEEDDDDVLAIVGRVMEDIICKVVLAEMSHSPVSSVHEIHGDEDEDGSVTDSEMGSSLDDFVDVTFEDGSDMNEATELMCVEYARRCVPHFLTVVRLWSHMFILIMSQVRPWRRRGTSGSEKSEGGIPPRIAGGVSGRY